MSTDTDIVWRRFPGVAIAGRDPSRPDWGRYGARLQRDVGLEWAPFSAVNVYDLPDDLLPGPVPLGVQLFEPPVYMLELPDDISRPLPQAGRLHARITYAIGNSGPIRIDCDWRGTVPVVAHKRLTVDVLGDWWRDNVSGPSGGRIDVSALLVPGERAPSSPPTYTFPSTRVLGDDGGISDNEAEFAVPAFATRVRASFNWADGDAPLGQYFIAFYNASHGALSFVDAASARESLFGDGHWLPPGTHRVVVTNRSPDIIRVSLSFVLGL